jgi:nucleoside-diphosphate kinase
MKNHKVFLKKIAYPEITLKDLYIGNILACYGRQLKIVDFADEFTKKNLLGESVSNK